MAAGLVPLCVEKLVEEEATEIRVSLVLLIMDSLILVPSKPLLSFQYCTLTEKRVSVCNIRKLGVAWRRGCQYIGNIKKLGVAWG